ncbi:MAG: DUF4861 family protein [Candidatus Latescibacterota bacterium]
MHRLIAAVSLLFMLLFTGNAFPADPDAWYDAAFESQDSAYRGKATAVYRVRINLVNTLNIPRKDCPIVIPRVRMPFPDHYPEWITVVDPGLPPQKGEVNGSYLLSQLDDLDKDGIWDELFFQADLKPREKKTVYIYIGRNMIDQSKHYVHAEIGMYGKHMMPWWETESIGWKFWYPDSADMYGKRNVRMMANIMLSNHYGHDTPYEVGADIMWVRRSFGAGGMCLFEFPSIADSLSRPRFSPHMGKGPFEDTRYAYDTILNGPIRAMVRARTLHWRTENGTYEYDQYQTTYRNKNYYTSRIQFTKFIPDSTGVEFGCGLQRVSKENVFYQKDGVVITATNDLAAYLTPRPGDPGLKKDVEQFLGLGMVVKDSYKPRFMLSKTFGENYMFRMPLTGDLSYEYLAAGAWSEGPVLTSAKEFREFVLQTAQEYNNPVIVESVVAEQKK